MADTIALSDGVGRMRLAPIGMRALVAILLPVLLPLLVVAAIEIPVKDLLLKLLSTLA